MQNKVSSKFAGPLMLTPCEVVPVTTAWRVLRLRLEERPPIWRVAANKLKKIKIYRTIILPVVLYGCETWSLTLRDERRLRVFENRVLRRVFGPKRGEVTGEWR